MGTGGAPGLGCPSCPRLPFISDPDVVHPMWINGQYFPNEVCGEPLYQDVVRLMENTNESFMLYRPVVGQRTITIEDFEKYSFYGELYHPLKLVTDGIISVPNNGFSGNNLQGYFHTSIWSGGEIELNEGFETEYGANFSAMILDSECGEPLNIGVPCRSSFNSKQFNPNNNSTLLKEFSIYPNFVQSSAELKIKTSISDIYSGHYYLKIINAEGKIIENIQLNSTYFGVNELATGNYFYELTIDNLKTEFSGKFIIL